MSGLVEGRIDFRAWTKQWYQAAGPDICVFQRPLEEWQLDNIRTARDALPNAFLVMELDDNVWEVPPASYHYGFIPEGVKARLTEAVSLCDAVSTTTIALADDLRALGAKDVRIIANLLPIDKFRERTLRPGAKIRVGFGGGVSHSGDLALIEPAMREIGSAVEWVFLGGKPEGIPLDMIEFHDGVSPGEFSDKMFALDIDLILAPLEVNRFNQCKSNLRLVEAGASCSAVAATDIEPYREAEPPVYAYCRTPEDWTAAIREFIAMPASKRMRHAHSLQAWAKRNYALQGKLRDRLMAWMPDSPAYWEPRAFQGATGGPVVACASGRAASLPPSLRNAEIAISLEAACERALLRGAGVLWLRSGTDLSPEAWDRMRGAIAGHRDVASVVPLSGDGPNSWPHLNRLNPMPSEMAEKVNRLAGKMLSGKRLELGVPAGPCIFLSGPALGLFGVPDATGMEGHEEAAIMEWGARARVRGWRHLQAPDAYVGTLSTPAAISENAKLRLQLRGTTQAIQTFGAQQIEPQLREDMEYVFLAGRSGFLKPGMVGLDGGYLTWKALRPKLPLPALRLSGEPSAVNVRLYGHTASTDWVLYLPDADRFDTLDQGVWAQLEQACAEAGPDVFAIYCDHEAEMEDGRIVPDFKPDFDLELFLGRDYVTPFVAVRSSWRPVMPPADEFGLYRLILAGVLIAQERGLKPQDVVKHVPHVLGRIKEAGAEKRSADAARRAEIARDLVPGLKAEAFKNLPGCVKTVRQPSSVPLVSIIVPTRGSGWLLQPCLNTILSLTDYPNYEIVVVMNAEGEPDLGRAAEDPRVRVIYWREPFNFSALNNFAVSTTNGQYLCLVNDDVRAGSREWLSAMVGRATQPDAGAVGARLIYSHGLVQHVGVISHKGANGHLHIGLPVQLPGDWGIAALAHENAAVTAACMLVSRENWEAVGGLREDLSHNYNDVAFCLELRRRGKRNIVETAAEMQHNESSTRPSSGSPAGRAKLLEENTIIGPAYPEDDPYWNPNYVFGANGSQIVGLNHELLRWDDVPPPEGAERVLVLNDRLSCSPTGGPAGTAIDVACAGNIPLVADLSGFDIVFRAPEMANVMKWDIRSPSKIARALSLLEVDRIILCSLVSPSGEAAAPAEALRCLGQVGVPVSYAPVDPDESTRPGERFEGYGAAEWHAMWDSFFKAVGHARPVAQAAE